MRRIDSFDERKAAFSRFNKINVSNDSMESIRKMVSYFIPKKKKFLNRWVFSDMNQALVLVTLHQTSNQLILRHRVKIVARDRPTSWYDQKYDVGHISSCMTWLIQEVFEAHLVKYPTAESGRSELESSPKIYIFVFVLFSTYLLRWRKMVTPFLIRRLSPNLAIFLHRSKYKTLSTLLILAV